MSYIDSLHSEQRARHVKAFLENFAAVLGAATLALLLFAVCHEYGYFSVIGSQFQTFVSTSDYFTNSTQWFLATLFLAVTWLDVKQITGAVNYLPAISRDRRTWIFPALIFSLFALEVLFSHPPIILLFFVFVYLWLTYGVNRALKWASAENVPNGIRVAVTAGPVLAMLAFVSGQQKGGIALSQVSDPYTVRMKGGELRLRVLLRNFDKGLLVRSPGDQRVEMIRWDQIEEVTKLSTKSGETFACRWFDMGCRFPQFGP